MHWDEGILTVSHTANVHVVLQAIEKSDDAVPILAELRDHRPDPRALRTQILDTITRLS